MPWASQEQQEQTEGTDLESEQNELNKHLVSHPWSQSPDPTPGLIAS